METLTLEPGLRGNSEAFTLMAFEYFMASFVSVAFKAFA